MARMLLWLSSTILRRLEQLEQPPGEVPLQAALDLPRGPALSGSARRVGPSLRVMDEMGEHDRVQRPVQLAVTAPVQPVADGLYSSQAGNPSFVNGYFAQEANRARSPRSTAQ